MTTPRYPRGSEWRRWDLQVHSPHSALNNGFGSDFDGYARRVFQTALAKGIAAVGVTDYFVIDGYRRLRQIQGDAAALQGLLGAQDADAARELLLLPNLEFRTSVVVSRPGRPDARVNFHVLFSNDLQPDTIEDHFLRELKFTAETAPGQEDERWSLTSSNLAALGARLKAQHTKFAGMTDLVVGMMNAVISHEEITAILERQASRFKDKYLLVTPADEDLSVCSWDGQAHLTRKLFIQKSHMLFSGNPNTRKFGLGLRHPTVEAFLTEFKSLKPCVHGSDSHSFDTLFEPAEDRVLWIKGDPTFEGLRQVLCEPADRVFIGPVPASLERARTRPTKIVESIQIRKSPGAATSEHWFNSDIPLNPELIAIIGNKGSGKSALADVLGLLGNTRRVDSFAFLNQERFRQPRNNKARHFEAQVRWADGKTDGPLSLSEDPAPEAVEKVRYIPQNYLEEICNEVTLGKDSRFYRELQDVIFSHVPESERQGFASLDDLLEHKGEEINRGIAMLVSELTDINRATAALEERLTPTHRRSLEQQLSEKRRELAAHDGLRPAEVTRPDSDPEAQAQSREATVQLEEARGRLQALDDEIKTVRLEDGQLARRKTAAERLITKLRNLQRQVDASMTESAGDLAEVGLARGQVVAFEIKLQPVEEVAEAVEQRRQAITADLNPNTDGSREAQRATLSGAIATLQDSLSAPQRAYQDYLQKLRTWEERRAEIVGAATTPGSLGFIEKAIADLADVPAELRAHERARRRKGLEILREKGRLRNYYRDYYGAVQEFLSSHELAMSDAFRVTFSVTMLQTGFSEAFLAKINQRKLGAFSGVENGATEVKRRTDGVDWNSAKSVIRFAEEVVAQLKGSPGSDRSVQEQLVQGETAQSVYDYLFAFEYLAPIYRLTWDGKGIEQLSPGERGNLLLIFYLLVDRDDIPLVIDQPEENLDNHTVVRTLVPCLKDAKRRRQIVVVTHNPNLAVVCDAEQIVHAEIRKERGHEVHYAGGSIEDSAMNRRIVDVLEGTRPAFDQRDARYQPST